MDEIIARRNAEPPDLLIGPLALWVGTGDGLSWPWLDLAVRVGEGWERIVDIHGALVQRPDLRAFLAALPGFVAGERADAVLASLGGALRLLLRRSEHGSLRGELWLQRGGISQTVDFSLWQGVLPPALAGAEALAARIAGEARGWRPTPARALPADPLLPRDSGIDEPEPERPPLRSWDAGLDAADAIAFDYVVDGYGWYGVEVRVGDRIGGFGGGYLTDPMGDLLRAALVMLAGSDRAEFTCNAEPGLTRVEFVSEILGVDVEDARRANRRDGCRIRIRDVDYQSGVPAEQPEFDALCRSPRIVAEAIYRMALRHFEDGAGPWSVPMAALEGALATVPCDG